MLMGPLVGDIATSFGLASETEIGNISAVFLLVGGVLTFVWVAVEDYLSKHYGSSRKMLLIIATILWSIGLFLSSLSRNYLQLFASQMLAAVGYAAITPLAFSMAMDLTPPDQRAIKFGLLDVASMIGVGVGFILSGILVSAVPWNVPFVIVASLGLVLAGFAMDIKEPKRGVQERELTDAMARGAVYDFHISRSGLWEMLKKRANLLLILFTIILYTATGSVSYYFIRMMVNDHGFSSALATLFLLATFSFQAVGAIFWTRRADKKSSNQPKGKVQVLLEGLLVGPAFLIIAFLLVFPVTDGLLIGIFALLIIVGWFLLSGLFSISFTILGEINPPEMRTTIFSLSNLAQTMGRGIGIFIMGILFSAFGDIYHYGFAIVGGLFFIAIIFILPLFRSVPRELSNLSRLLRERANELKE